MTAPEPEVTDVVTDDELDTKRDEVAQLREELAQVEADRAAREQAQANAVTSRQLDNEADRLRALIAAAKGQSPLDAAQEKLERDGERSIVTESGATPPTAATPEPAPVAPAPASPQPAETAAETTGEGA